MTGEAKPVVVGVDDSEAAVRALRWALDEALVRGCEVRAVTVWSVDVTRQPPWSSVELIRERHERTLHETVRRATEGRERLPTVVPMVVEGSAAGALIEVAEEAALLVVARRAGARVRRALLGSVSSACVKHATVPVVVVPPPTAEPFDLAEQRAAAERTETAERGDTGDAGSTGAADAPGADR